MSFARYLRPLLLLIGAAIGASVLAQFAIARSAVIPADLAAKAIGCDFSAPEPDEGGFGDISDDEPIDGVFIQTPRLQGEALVAAPASERLADRRGATLVVVVQLLV
ncbi:MAG: hypothetical protein ACKOTE_07630 [Opitutaceae bacterium]